MPPHLFLYPCHCLIVDILLLTVRWTVELSSLSCYCLCCVQDVSQCSFYVAEVAATLWFSPSISFCSALIPHCSDEGQQASSQPICQSSPLLRTLTHRANLKDAALSTAGRSNTLHHLTSVECFTWTYRAGHRRLTGNMLLCSVPAWVEIKRGVSVFVIRTGRHGWNQ